MCHVFTFQPDDFSLIMVSNLLGIEKTQLQKWLCNRKLVATGEVYIKPLTIQEVSQMSNATYFTHENPKKRTCEANPVGENSSSIFFVLCLKYSTRSFSV